MKEDRTIEAKYINQMSEFAAVRASPDSWERILDIIDELSVIRARMSDSEWTHVEHLMQAVAAVKLEE